MRRLAAAPTAVKDEVEDEAVNDAAPPAMPMKRLKRKKCQRAEADVAQAAGTVGRMLMAVASILLTTVVLPWHEWRRCGSD